MQRSGRVLVGFIVLALWAPAVSTAQEPKWLNDFEAARKEAKAQQKPIVMDFGTDNCIWCRRLEATTFQDAGVKKMLAERFIAVRLDANQNRPLVQSLNIQTYPTLVFADTNGKILGLHEGYVEAEQFRRQLERCLRESGASGAAAPPAETAKSPEKPAEPPRLAKVIPADQLLKQAMQDEKDGQFLCALDRYRRIQTQHANTPEAAEAQKLSAAIKSDPLKARQVRIAMEEIQAEMDLAAAEQLLREGRLPEAAMVFTRIQQCYPLTRGAALAQAQLARMPQEQVIIRTRGR